MARKKKHFVKLKTPPSPHHFSKGPSPRRPNTFSLLALLQNVTVWSRGGLNISAKTHSAWSINIDRRNMKRYARENNYFNSKGVAIQIITFDIDTLDK